MALDRPDQTRKWWKDGVCYQVWPQSFKDSNNDGIGDIPGLISKIDYLKDLGVDYIWMSPMYASPREDYGYDISDYEAVDPRFGTIQDMDDLIEALHSRGMRLMLDLVINHTSSQHKWFQESAKGKDNAYSNYYIWRDPKIVNGERSPPNNWRSLFGGSAWEYVESRDQYYLRLFLKSMPDLNWEDAEVRQAIYKTAIEFWLAKGVDGFRVDVVNLYSKDVSYPDAPVRNEAQEYQHPPPEAICNGPRMHEFLQEQRKQALDKFGDVVLVGECGDTQIDTIKEYLSVKNRELDMMFDFDIFAGRATSFDKPIWEWVDNRTLKVLRKGIMKSQSFISEHGLWPTTFMENHDTARCISNYGARNPEYATQSGKLLALLIATMSGTLFIYQGQEIGMRNIPLDWPESDLKDPLWIDLLEEAYSKNPDDPAARRNARESFQRGGRDHSRTPVQWTNSPETHAGFSSSTTTQSTKPWIRVNENFRDGINVADQINDPKSLLSFWRNLLRFRKSHAETLIYGHTEFLDVDNEHVLSVVKHAQTGDDDGKKEIQKRFLVVMNYSDGVRPLLESEMLKSRDGEVVVSMSGLDLNDRNGILFGTGFQGKDVDDLDLGVLQPWEGRVYQL